MTLSSDFDPTTFITANVVDTCAVWNLLSSESLYVTAQLAGLSACITEFVRYECLDKPRTRPSPADDDLKRRARTAIEQNELGVYGLDIEDLQELDVLRRRKALGLGELSSIVFAKKVNIALMSDDRKATKLATVILGSLARSSTTPRLLGWLLFKNLLSDDDVEIVIEEHNGVGGPLEPHYRRMLEIIAQYKRVQARLHLPPTEHG